MIDLKKLSEPFPPERIHWRVGSVTKDKKRGMALAYIDARDVMRRLDEVCGPENWQCRYHVQDGGPKVTCDIGILIDQPGASGRRMDWIWKANGAGDTNVEGDKGAYSDAMKRAAVLWGIGQYLYDLAGTWVDIDNRGRIAENEYRRLRLVLEGKQPDGMDVDWKGPLNKGELKNEITRFITLCRECNDEAEYDDLLNEFHSIIEQCRADTPDWFEPAGDARGMKDTMKETLARLNPTGAG